MPKGKSADPQTWHIHVYQIAGMMDFEIDGVTEADARTKALERAKAQPQWKPSDCTMIAMSFDSFGMETK